MKNFFLLLLLSILFFNSCGKSDEEIAMENKKTQDSLNEVIESAKAEAAEKAKKELAEELKQKIKDARNINNPGEKFVRIKFIHALESKANGSKWDVFAPKPDIIGIMTVDGKKIIQTPEKENHYVAKWDNVEATVTFKNDSWIRISVWDMDDSDHDLIGDWEGDFSEFIKEINNKRFSFSRVRDIKIELENIIR